jgi:hypothetical protein
MESSYERMETITLPAIKASQSLVGIGPITSYPVRFGNYFSILDTRSVVLEDISRDEINNLYFNAIRVLNMWAENFDKSCIDHLTDGLVQVRYYERTINTNLVRQALITDPRIPMDWFYPTIYTTGTYPLSESMQIDANSIMERLL